MLLYICSIEFTNDYIFRPSISGYCIFYYDMNISMKLFILNDQKTKMLNIASVRFRVIEVHKIEKHKLFFFYKAFMYM